MFRSIFLMRLYQNRLIYVFRMLVVYSVVISTLVFAWNAYYYMTPTSKINFNFALMLTIPIAVSQYLTAAVFILFGNLFSPLITNFVWAWIGGHFYFRVRHMRQMSLETVRALKRLSWLALVAFACYVPLASANLLYFREKIHMPVYNMIIQATYVCGLSLRANALMLILGIKIAPSKLREPTSLEKIVQRIASIFQKPPTPPPSELAHKGGNEYYIHNLNDGPLRTHQREEGRNKFDD